MSALKDLDESRSSLRILKALKNQGVSDLERLQLIEYFNKTGISKTEFYKTHKILKKYHLIKEYSWVFEKKLYTVLDEKGILISQLIDVIEEVFNLPNECYVENEEAYYNEWDIERQKDAIEQLNKNIKGLKNKPDFLMSRPKGLQHINEKEYKEMMEKMQRASKIKRK